MEEGGRYVVVDLESCSGVDSTFMGTLAGLTRRLMPLGGAVQIVSPTERALAALESLGLDMILDIEPLQAPWRGKIEEIRVKLQSAELGDSRLHGIDQARHVLDSHVTLSELNPENEEKFKGVTETLRDEIKRKDQ